MSWKTGTAVVTDETKWKKSQYTQHDSDTVPLATLRYSSRNPTTSLEILYLKNLFNFSTVNIQYYITLKRTM